MKLDYFLSNDGLCELKLVGDYVNFVEEKEQIAFFKDLSNNKNIKNIIVDGKKLDKWDSTLVVIVFEIIKISKAKSINVNIDTLPDGFKRLIKLAFSVDRKPKENVEVVKQGFLERFGDNVYNKYKSFSNGFRFFNESIKSLFRFFTGRATMRHVDFLSCLESCGYKALPIVSLISFMVGLILAFVGSMQLKAFGAQIYVPSFVSIAMVRIMGPAMAGVIMAGRTGASYAATIGSMQVNEEISALKTMGIPVMDFLTLPRLLSLTIMMPILSMFADLLGIIGGATVGTIMIGIPFTEYWRISIEILDLKNYLVGIFHGYVYGWVIALCGCYYGINCGKDADSVGKATTNAVVASIVWIVVSTGIITFILQFFNI